MQTVFFSKTLKANKKLHQYFKGSIKILRTELFSDGRQLEIHQLFYTSTVFASSPSRFGSGMKNWFKKPQMSKFYVISIFLFVVQFIIQVKCNFIF